MSTDGLQTDLDYRGRHELGLVRLNNTEIDSQQVFVAKRNLSKAQEHSHLSEIINVRDSNQIAKLKEDDFISFMNPCKAPIYK